MGAGVVTLDGKPISLLATLGERTVCRVKLNLTTNQPANASASRDCRSSACCTTAVDALCWCR